MIAILISLERAAERRALFVEAIQRLSPGVEIRRARAVDVSSPDWTVPEGYSDPNWASDRWALRPSDIEIFLSHKDAWEQLAESGQGGFVFEDDVLFSESFGGAAATLDAASPEGIIKIDGLGSPHLLGPIEAAGQLTLRRVEAYLPSAAAYYLSAETARKLSASARIERTVDDYLFDPYPEERGSAGHGLAIYQLDPAITVQGQFGTYSDLGRSVPDFVASTKRSDLAKRKSRVLAGPVHYRILKEWRRWRARKAFARRKDRVLASGGVFQPPVAPDDLRWF